jgi:hypothetical protein
VRKNPPLPKMIHHKGKLEGIKGKLPVVLVKPESCLRSPMLSAEFL